MDLPEYDKIERLTKSEDIYLTRFSSKLENLHQGEIVITSDAEPFFEVVSAEFEDEIIQTMSFVHYEGLLKKVGLKLSHIFSERIITPSFKGQLFFALNYYQPISQIKETFLFNQGSDESLYLTRTVISEKIPDYLMNGKTIGVLRDAAKKFNQPFGRCQVNYH